MRKILFAVVCLLFCGTARAQNFVPIVSGVATVDASQGTNAQTSSFLVILTANVTSLEIIKPKTGQQITIILQQDSTGGRTVSCAADVLNCVTVTSTASAVTSQAFAYNSNTNTWSGLSGKSSAGSGTVTSVGQTVPSWLTVTGSPVTTNGTLAVTPTSGQTSHQVIGTCGAGTTFGPCALVAGDLPAGGYTLDQIGNLAATKTFLIGSNTPLTWSDPGVFNMAAMNTNNQSIVTGSGTNCDTTDIFTPYFYVMALVGIVCDPPGAVNISGVGDSNGVVGIFLGRNTGTADPIFGFTGGVGVSGSGYCQANNEYCWGMNSAVSDLASQTGNQLIGNEIDVQTSSTATKGYGLLLSYRGNGQPTSDNFPALYVQPPAGTASFTSGLEFANGSIKGGATGVSLGRNSAASSQAPSLLQYFHAWDTGDVNENLQLESSDFFNAQGYPFTQNNASGIPEAWAISMSDSATSFTLNQLVKVDPSNADSIVLCTTSDTFCNGFILANQSILNFWCIASATYCPVAMTPGNRVQGILGTGTCAIGNYVVPDTTTNGRVKCIATQPTAGYEDCALGAVKRGLKFRRTNRVCPAYSTHYFCDQVFYGNQLCCGWNLRQSVSGVLHVSGGRSVLLCDKRHRRDLHRKHNSSHSQQ